MLPNVKNVEMMAINSKGPLYRLAVAGKKRLYLYEYAQGSYTLFRELIVPDTVTSMIWYGNSICVAYKKEYSILNLINSNSCDVLDVGVPVDKAKPIINFISEAELLVSANENLGFFVNFDGGLASKNPITWNDSAIAFVRCTHYVVSLLKNNTVEVFSILDPKLIQRITFPKSFAGITLDGDDGQVLVISDNQVYGIVPTSVESQVEEFIKAVRIEEALALLYKISPSSEQVKEFHAKAGFVLFRDLQFDDAMSHFHLSTIDPREIISFFPELISISVINHPFHLFKLNPELSIENMISRYREIKTKLEDKDKMERMNLQESDLQILIRGKISLAKYLWRLRSDSSKWLVYPSNIKVACDNAMLFLAVELSHSTLQAMSIYTELPYSITQLLDNNACLLEECETFLLNHKHFNSLALLYKSKGLFQKALDIWSHIGSGEFQDVDIECTGIPESIALLSKMPEDVLLWKYSEWVVGSNPLEGLKIFTEASRSIPLSPDKVIAYFQKMNNDNSYYSELTTKYLEYLVHVEQNTTSKYHNMLGTSYFHRVLKMLKSTNSVIEALTEVPNRFRLVIDENPKLGDENGSLAVYRSALMEFLQTSSFYDASVILDLIEPTPLYFEAILLNSKLERHHQVLEIYVKKLADYDGAYTYCIDTSEEAQSEKLRSDLFILLLKIYFYNNDHVFKDIYEKNAMLILYEFAEYIEPTEALSILPDSIPIVAVTSYLNRVIPITLHTYRQSKITANLEKTCNRDCHYELIKSKSRFIEMNRDSRCKWCHKHIAERTVFEVFPDNTVVHLHCSSAYRESINFRVNKL